MNAETLWRKAHDKLQRAWEFIGIAARAITKEATNG